MPSTTRISNVVGANAAPRLCRAGLVVVALAGCSSSSYPTLPPMQSVPIATERGVEPSADGAFAGPGQAATPESQTLPQPDLHDVSVLVHADRPGRPIDRRVLGTNVPAWLGPELLADPAFIQATVASGTTLLRMPGGSWSNWYNWAACENADPDGCAWTWAARPSDFIDFMEETQLPGMWTLSINATAESAAAAVAFFNGSVDDSRPIGTDRNGVGWGTVGMWAALRAEHGNPDPTPIALWEVGNEVFAGRPESGGAECASFGWEDVWTCDGAEYMSGDEDHDGYLDIRAAMIAVDPSIEVGAVGVADPGSWSEWGSEVIEGAGGDLDFYVVHQYGYDSSPDNEDALTLPASLWPGVVDGVRSALPPDVPLAVTEYNLVSMESGDTNRSMTRAVNALYIADSIGQLIASDVAIANQWNLANGTTASGTDYGMVDVEDWSPFPLYHAMAMWGETGDTLLETQGSAGDSVRVYPTRRPDGTLAVILLNVDDQPASFGIGFGRASGEAAGMLTTVRTDDLDADLLTQDDPIVVAADGRGTVSLELPPWSISLLELGLDG